MQRLARYIIVEKERGNINSGTERRLFDRILKYTGVFSSVQGVAMLVTVVMAKVKSLLLGPVGFGITENLNRTTDIVKNATNLGIQTVAVPQISQSANESDQADLLERIMVTRSWALLTAIIGMVVCLALAPVLGRWAFDDTGYAVDFIFLSLSVAAASVTGGEMAVMKGTKYMRNVALSQLFASVLSLCISFPLYWFLRLDGIIPALVLSALGTMAVTCFYSFRSYPYRARPFSRVILQKGLGMIGFGVSLTVAAFLGAWAWSFIARYLTGKGGAELTGMYSAGYLLVNYLTTFLLSVVDSEYYPRLSATVDDREQTYRLMNNQSLAMCMLAAPLVILFMICIPVVVFVVLEYEKFQGSILLAQMAVIGLFFKAVYQPISYLVLAKSDSRIFLLQEVFCYILLIVCAVCGYAFGGMIGLGISLSVWEFSFLVIVLVVGRLRYGFVMSAKLVKYFLTQGVLIALAAFCAVYDFSYSLAVSIMLCVMSILISLRFFSTHTTFLPLFFARITRRSKD